MPLASTITTPIFLANIASAGCIGISSIQLATGLANGLSSYAISGITAVTTDAGQTGSGKGTGTSILTPASIIPPMIGFFASQGIAGVLGIPLATGIANALSICISSSIVQTVHPSVGSGTGVGSLVPTSGIPFFVSGFAAAGIVGVQGVNLATAVANGLDASLPTTVVTVGIIGASGSSSSAGAGTGKII